MDRSDRQPIIAKSAIFTGSRPRSQYLFFSLIIKVTNYSQGGMAKKSGDKKSAPAKSGAKKSAGGDDETSKVRLGTSLLNSTKRTWA